MHVSLSQRGSEAGRAAGHALHKPVLRKPRTSGALRGVRAGLGLRCSLRGVARTSLTGASRGKSCATHLRPMSRRRVAAVLTAARPVRQVLQVCAAHVCQTCTLLGNNPFPMSARMYLSSFVLICMPSRGRTHAQTALILAQTANCT
jgi:hypothetical protein